MLVKTAIIKKIKNKWVIFSRKGKRLGEYSSKKDAVKRLRQIEYFKHKKASLVLDLSNIEELSYSCVCREIFKTNEKLTEDFLSIFKKNFDAFAINNEDVHIPVLVKTIKDLNEVYEIRLPTLNVKTASISEYGSPEDIGIFLSHVIKFMTSRIKKENRQKSLNSLKSKIYSLNIDEISHKKIPASASLGHTLTLIKLLLSNQDPHFIRRVIFSAIKHL